MKQTIFPTVLLSSVLLWVSGCSSLSPQNPVDNSVQKFIPQTPSQWSALPGLLTPGEVTNGNWWTEFKDGSLNRVVGQAVGNNYQIAQAKARTAQARAQAVIADSSRLPLLGAGLQADRTRQEAGAAGYLTNETYSLGLLNISWEADVWGRLKAQSAAANESYLASNDALRAVRQVIAAQTAKTYFAVVESKQQVALSQRTLQVMSETARQVGNRADVGVGSPGDKYLSLANRDSAKAGLAGYQEALDRVSRQLQVLVGTYPDGKVATANALVNLPPLPKAGVPASLLSRRPDILAAERQLRASGFNLESAQRSLLPSINLTTGIGTASTELRNLLNGNFGFWSLGGSILQPIFQGGRLRANVRLNEALQQEAANAYANIALTAFSEVETALSVQAKIKRRQTALCSAAQSAKEAERISFNRYRQGIEPYLTVLESQQRTLNAASACISARLAGLNNYIDLQLALGGGFEQRVESLPSAKALFKDRFSKSPSKDPAH